MKKLKSIAITGFLSVLISSSALAYGICRDYRQFYDFAQHKISDQILECCTVEGEVDVLNIKLSPGDNALYQEWLKRGNVTLRYDEPWPAGYQCH